MGKVQDFKIIKTNIDPKFIGKHISLENVTHFTDGIIDPRKPRKPKKPSKFDQIISRLDKMDTRMDTLTTIVEGLVVDMKDVKSTLVQHTNRMDKHWGAGK